jgi:ribosome-associated protein
VKLQKPNMFGGANVTADEDEDEEDDASAVKRPARKTTRKH